jgi:hypothetical protein
MGSYTTSDENQQYTGQFEDGEYSGDGSLKSVSTAKNSRGTLEKNTTEYQGEFRSSLYHGRGIFKDSLSDTTYEGDFCEGIKSGYGRLTRTSNGLHLYEGEWVLDLPCGHGTFMLEGGHIYTGSMLNGLPHGDGHCRYVDGGEYTGSWKNGRRNGYGSFIGAALDEYKGKWVGDLRSGKGIWKSSRGDIYDGIWDLNLPHDKGRMTYILADGCTDPTRERSYDGCWNHGKRSGPGEVTYANGVTKKGLWNSMTRDTAFDDEIGQTAK